MIKSQQFQPERRDLRLVLTKTPGDAQKAKSALQGLHWITRPRPCASRLISEERCCFGGICAGIG
jgi:hypothetical protein